MPYCSCYTALIKNSEVTEILRWSKKVTALVAANYCLVEINDEKLNSCR